LSDEIYSDFVGAPFEKTHIPIASISPAIADITITFNSPSKPFNLSGLSISWIHI